MLAGGVGDGVLTQITYGPNQYVFTSQAKAKVTVGLEARHEKVKKAQKIRFSGKVEPAATNTKVALELKKGGKWTTVKTRNLSASGSFRFGARPERLGKLRYRVTVTETNATLAAKSHVVKVLVTKR